MTTPASGPISIQSIKNEFEAQYGGYNAISSWGYLVLGRTEGLPVALAEFFSKTSLHDPFNSDTSATIYSTPWGGIETYAYTVPGFSTVMMYVDGEGAIAWPHLISITLTEGYVIVPGHFTSAIAGDSGRPFHYWNGPQLAEGTAYWRFI